MFEFLFETPRAVMNLFMAGVVDRSPSITFIITHAGGALAPLVDRFTLFASSLPNIPGDVSQATVKAAPGIETPVHSAHTTLPIADEGRAGIADP